eukprot:9332686-Heterocapsa_arctica.AAC.1
MIHSRRARHENNESDRSRTPHPFRDWIPDSYASPVNPTMAPPHISPASSPAHIGMDVDAGITGIPNSDEHRAPQAQEPHVSAETLHM